jgi:hypothetical protein
MSMKSTVLRVTLFALLVGAVATVPALAGSAVIGSVAGSMNATLGGQSLLPNTTIFSGDSLQVRDGVAVVAVGTKSRVIFGRDTVASFLRDSSEVTVLLSQGNVSLYHPTDGTSVRVKAGPVSITPAAGFKTLGEIALVDRSVVITAKEGALQVDGPGPTKSVSKGQTIVIVPKTAQGKGGGGAGWGGGSTALQLVTLGAGTTGAILAGVSMSRAASATTAANGAISAANAATSAGNTSNATASSALSVATAANSNAAAALSQATLAASASKQAQFLAACIDDYILMGNTASAHQIYGTNCPSMSPTGP